VGQRPEAKKQKSNIARKGRGEAAILEGKKDALF
jgi:hypothetical protein